MNPRLSSRALRALTASAALLGAALATSPAHADDPAPGPKFTGHLDLVSRYILRGDSTTYGNSKPGLGNEGADAPESDRPALQWGLDDVLPSGWYVGYFGSMINYSYKQLGDSYSDRSITDFQHDKSIENDLYGGYSGSVGDLGYSVGGTGYVYINGSHANALETKLGLTYGAFGLNAQTLLNDVVWGNRGDTYWTLTYATTLPYDIAFNASLGAYTYRKEGKYLGTKDTLTGTACAPGEAFNVNGCYAGNGPSSGGFRHLILGITQPIGSSGVVWGLQGILGGENRFGVTQGNRLVGSISYTF
jgi:uncharacterized protein (TIGR02001 family)